MTRRGGSGSRRSRGSRDPVAAHGGWAPLAPPREAPARPGTGPLRDRCAGPSRGAAAAAMSPGKPGAGGAGTRRTGWRRRRRRRWLQAASGAPGLGRTAGPDSRGPDTFQSARGMKPAAREARPPRRPSRLRWALPPLLLLCRLGQILCHSACDDLSCSPVMVLSTTNETLPSELPGNYSARTPTDWGSQSHGNLSVNEKSLDPVWTIASKSPTSVSLKWKNGGRNASEYKVQSENGQLSYVPSESGINITHLSPATLYNFSITSGTDGTERDTAVVTFTTEPLPVSRLCVAFKGVVKVALTWETGVGNTTCRILLEDQGSHKELDPNLIVNTTIKSGSIYEARCVSESEKMQTDSVAGGRGSDATGTGGMAGTAPGSKCQLDPSRQPSTFPANKTEVLLLGLKSGTWYKATVYSQAEDGTEGQPMVTEFRTDSFQVLDLEAANISATSMTLTWKMNDNGSCLLYTYNVKVVGDTELFNLTVNETQTVLTELSPNTFYNITVCPSFQDGSECIPGFLQVYTRPAPVSDFRVTAVNTRSIGLAWSSKDSDSFKILTRQDGAAKLQTQTTNQSSIFIGDLYPGTKYCFEIVPLGRNGTEGDSQNICSTTGSSGVCDIRVTHVTTAEIQLEWQSVDNASDYIYHLDLRSEHSAEQTNSSHRAFTFRGLVPGTLYNITIVPEVQGVPGRPSSIAQYTRPSTVFRVEISTNTTAAAIRWQNSDKASPNYTYRLLVEREGNSSNATEVVTGIGVTGATVPDLIPGSGYTIQIFAQVGEGTESLEPGWQSFCTDPAPVASVQCEVVPKTPTLVLRWACPAGTSMGFQVEVSRGDWRNETHLEGCPLEEAGTEYWTEVTHLNFSTSYDINVTTLSCNKMATPTLNSCVTSITDPPPPDGSPNITSISHNSVKVKFSGFEASHGPIKAYALILTTGEANPSAEVLSHTYEDFKKGASATYVTYFITTGENASSEGLSEVLKYEINVGNESNTHGYYNGKLEPLGSYRACVAGFTNITFGTDGLLIDGNRSYVSFSRYSDAVFLPQDPGVICGAVFGCIFGALVIVAVGGFIFWRKKRKDAKHNDLPFSQIKSKLVRVENFEAYFKKQQADSNCGFAEEYEDLKLVGINQPKYAAELAENRGKNRYNNVLPYDISRVRLSVHTHSADDYVNANYMPGYHSKKEFIATQGPLPNTLKDFWRMVWEKNVYAIVMLTKCVEQGRTKCEEYWPSKQAKDYGSLTVAMTSEIVLPEWTIRDFTVKNNMTSDSHPLRQFHFTSWPDHGVPDTTDLLINFRYLVRDYMKQSPPESPVLVHCSAGVGRTGTFIAIDRLIYQMENENAVDVYGIVYDLRMHRPLMVQTEDQYVFLNQCVLDIVRSQRDSKVDLIYQNTTAMTIYENLAPVATLGHINGHIA
ncbi:receptor-type tyrosine-protein phosphatase eta isoform X2 [Artibeus jamaicensis]|uniref:receptor-type tyrosine-protein phosphatase eta isoform X2 n=1 Tax=Artibeus jamaicensis TaxID=9417 RepID=UPI00235AA831|nr:receptor-type tyrosine-protein phosphatase eta isoform X2 [Artibeus jamaicensis]